MAPIPAIAQRGQQQARLTRITTFVNEFTWETKTIDDLEVRDAQLAEIQEQFMSYHRQVLDELQEDDEMIDQDQKAIAFEDNFFDVSAKIKRLLKQGNKDDASQTSSCHAPTIAAPSTGLRRPTVTVSPFDGQIEDWMRFKEMFQLVFGDPTKYSDIERFHQLRVSLQGKALRRIEALPYAAESYDAAWKLLSSKYEDNHQLISIYISKLLDLPTLKDDDYLALDDLIDQVNTVLATLRTLGQNVDSWDMIVVSLVGRCLGPLTREHWQKNISVDELPTWKLMENCLQKHTRVQQATNGLFKVHKEPFTAKPRRHSSAVLAATSSSCPHCKEMHYLYTCQKFHQLSIADRYEILKKERICFNCLNGLHSGRECPSTKRCKKCNRSHHTTLHSEGRSSQEEATPTVVAHATRIHQHQVLLSTAVVYLLDGNGHQHKCRALLDNASQEHFITEGMVRQLNLQTKPTRVPIGGINNTHSYIKACAHATMQSTTEDATWMMKFLVVPRITGQLPSANVSTEAWQIPAGIRLADPDFNITGPIDLLIGGAMFNKLLKEGRIELTKGLPIMLNTKLGWIIGGEVNSNQPSCATYCNLVTNQQLSNQIEKFWKLEGCDPADEQSEHEQCEEHFIKTHQKGKDGKYIVQIPFKPDVSSIGATKHIASKQLDRQLTRLARDVVLREQYESFMREYETLGHMEPVKNEEEDITPVYYLPHHGVIKQSSSTTKLRVVFNGSQASTTGESINDFMYNGGVVQDDLLDIIIRFREYLHVFGTDISKMYRQIWVDPAQCDLQRILWKRPEDNKAISFRLKTITYGTASAPYLATRVLNQMAHDNQVDFPLAAQAILKHTYVDDILCGNDDLMEATKMQKELSQLFQSSGMHLHKWCANNPSLLRHLPLEDLETISAGHESDGRSTIKALGICWEPIQDVFLFQWNTDINRDVTKRNVLSCIASMYDPLGLISPVIITLKIFMQELWKLKISWDTELDAALVHKWDTLRQDMQLITNIKVPRCLKSFPACNVQLHGFTDASLIAIGACLYLRVETNQGRTTSHLICSKTKVAPLKTSTVPRLELAGAVLLSDLVARVATILEIPSSQITLWSDSTIVLAWIGKNPSSYRPFVQNRLTRINNNTANITWRHVRTSQSPVDLASRGMTAKMLEKNDLWWTGPSFLCDSSHLWPKLSTAEMDDFNVDALKEERTTLTMLSTTTEKKDFLKRMSCFRRR